MTGGGSRYPTYDYAYVGRRLRERRVELNLTVEELARAVQMTPDFVESIESGKVYERFTGIIVLALELGVEPRDLFSQTSHAAYEGSNVIPLRRRSAN